MAAALGGEKLGEFISFATVELLWKVLTAKRWEILQAMTGQGEMAVREIARRVDRDVKAVHGDVQALLVAGVLDRTASGRVIFPYDAVRVDFTLRKAA
ncbi:MAG: transcriptional regulator [Rhodospirillaceae bacterium]|nr:transcriptional regulator [Rhodospirillaceae bacterium]